MNQLITVSMMFGLIALAIALIIGVTRAVVSLTNAISHSRERSADRRQFEHVFGFPHPKRPATESERKSVQQQMRAMAIMYVGASDRREKSEAEYIDAEKSGNHELIGTAYKKLHDAIVSQKAAEDDLCEAIRLASPRVLVGLYPKSFHDLVEEVTPTLHPRRRRTTKKQPTPINRSA